MPNTDQLVEKVRLRLELPPPAECRAIRVRARASQEEVAEVVGVTRETIARYEAGTRRPRGTQLETYLTVLRVLARESAP